MKKVALTFCTVIIFTIALAPYLNALILERTISSFSAKTQHPYLGNLKVLKHHEYYLSSATLLEWNPPKFFERYSRPSVIIECNWAHKLILVSYQCLPKKSPSALSDNNKAIKLVDVLELSGNAYWSGNLENKIEIKELPNEKQSKLLFAPPTGVIKLLSNRKSNPYNFKIEGEVANFSASNKLSYKLGDKLKIDGKVDFRRYPIVLGNLAIETENKDQPSNTDKNNFAVRFSSIELNNTVLASVKLQLELDGNNSQSSPETPTNIIFEYEVSGIKPEKIRASIATQKEISQGLADKPINPVQQIVHFAESLIYKGVRLKSRFALAHGEEKFYINQKIVVLKDPDFKNIFYNLDSFLRAFSFELNMELPKTLASRHEISNALINTNFFVDEYGLLKSNVNIQRGVILLNDKRVSLDELIKIFNVHARKQ